MSNRVPVFELYPGEFGYLALMLVVSGYMWYGSYEYDGLAGFFPRLMAIIVFVLSLTLFLRRLPIFPESVRSVIEESSGTFTEQGSLAEVEDEEEPQEDVERTGATRKTTVLGLLTGAYMLFGFLFGLLWGTPLYIIAYLRYTNYSWVRTIGIAATVTVIVYVMMVIFNFTLETGMILEMYEIEVPISLGIDGPVVGILPMEVM